MAALSLFVLIGHAVIPKFHPTGPRPEVDDNEDNVTNSPSQGASFYNITRLLCTIALFGLQLTTRSETSACAHLGLGNVLCAIYVSIGMFLVVVCDPKTHTVALLRVPGTSRRTATSLDRGRCALNRRTALMLASFRP